jgi:glycosyltransferase involved in cell wall biosynthesis
VSRILVVSTDHFGKAMAGPAIRCWEMCRVLAGQGHSVRLGVRSLGESTPDGFEILLNSDSALSIGAEWADVIVVQGLALSIYPMLKLSKKRLVVDIYDPFNLEILELFHDSPWDTRVAHYTGQQAALVDQLRWGDFFLCASEKQRDYWLGALSVAGRVNPHTHGNDRLLRRLIDVAPFGIDPSPPQHSGKPAAKGVLPGIGKDDRLLIWGGGIYNWFDPLSLLRSWPKVLEHVPNARLLFLGVKHPSPDVPAMAIATRAIELSEELGLRDRTVHFNMEWVPYERRKDFLLESELGVSMHFEHLETAFSFRTRILDYIWSGVPIVATEGDEFARWIQNRGTGRVVSYENPASIADAIIELLTDGEARAACCQAVAAARSSFFWEEALAPLARYCAAPWSAPDLLGAARADPAAIRSLEIMNSVLAPKALGPRMLFFFRREGPMSLVRRMSRALLRKMPRSRPAPNGP